MPWKSSGVPVSKTSREIFVLRSYNFRVNDPEEALRKARQFADSAYADALNKSTKEFQEKLAFQRSQLAARGIVMSSAMSRGTAELCGKRIDDLVLARLNGLLEGYELYGVPLDDELASNTTQEVMSLKHTLLLNSSKSVTTVDLGPVKPEIFAQLLQNESTVSRATVNVQVQRRQLTRKKNTGVINTPHAEPEFRWEDLDQRLLSHKLQELSNEMQERSVEGERKAAFDTRQSGNAAGYLPRLFDFHQRLTDEWAERLYAAHCETWVQQNRTVSGAFIRAVRDRALLQLIAVRKSTVQAGVSLRGTRIRERPNPAALGDWNRRMDRLASRWSQKMEADAAAEEYRASRPVNLDDDRHFARLAIEEARRSVAEDDRPHPRVGAVVVKNGKILAKAHRGENPKSHAEYVALEEKLSNETLAGATVYTTLEPCIKRNPPKICCAQRLVERKVARVLIGMLDPNPDIRGLGDQLLSEAGIEVQLFPRDLRAQVEEMNREFIRDQKEKWKARTSSATG